jgi:hypothetical protein
MVAVTRTLPAPTRQVVELVAVTQDTRATVWSAKTSMNVPLIMADVAPTRPVPIHQVEEIARATQDLPEMD